MKGRPEGNSNIAAAFAAAWGRRRRNIPERRDGFAIAGDKLDAPLGTGFLLPTATGPRRRRVIKVDLPADEAVDLQPPVSPANQADKTKDAAGAPAMVFDAVVSEEAPAVDVAGVDTQDNKAHIEDQPATGERVSGRLEKIRVEAKDGDEREGIEAPENLPDLPKDATAKEVDDRLKLLEVDGVAAGEVEVGLDHLPEDATEKQVIARLRELGLEDTTVEDDIARERAEKIEGITPSALRVLRHITARHHGTDTINSDQIEKEQRDAKQQEQVGEALTTLEARQTRVAGYVSDKVGKDEEATAEDYQRVLEAFSLMGQEQGVADIVDTQMLRYLAERQLEVAIKERDEAAHAKGVGGTAKFFLGTAATQAGAASGVGIFGHNSAINAAFVLFNAGAALFETRLSFNFAQMNKEVRKQILREKEKEVARARMQLGLEPFTEEERIASEAVGRSFASSHPTCPIDEEKQTITAYRAMRRKKASDSDEILYGVIPGYWGMQAGETGEPGTKIHVTDYQTAKSFAEHYSAINHRQDNVIVAVEVPLSNVVEVQGKGSGKRKERWLQANVDDMVPVGEVTDRDVPNYVPPQSRHQIIDRREINILRNPERALALHREALALRSEAASRGDEEAMVRAERYILTHEQLYNARVLAKDREELLKRREERRQQREERRRRNYRDRYR